MEWGRKGRREDRGTDGPLGTHANDSARRRTNEHYALLGEKLGEFGVFAQKTVARMNSLLKSEITATNRMYILYLCTTQFAYVQYLVHA